MSCGQAGEAKPELLDDWDQRLVVTTVTVSPEGDRITLSQEAEKDQVCMMYDVVEGTNILFSLQASVQDSMVVLEVEQEEADTLIMTCQAGEVVGWRKFDRQIVNSKFAERKISSPY